MKFTSILMTGCVLACWTEPARPQVWISPPSAPGERAWAEGMNTAFARQLQGDYPAAVALLKGLVKQAESFGATDERLGIAWNNLAFAYQDMGHYLESERAFERSIAILRDRGGLGDVRILTMLNNLMCMYVDSRQYGKAERLSERISKVFLQAQGKIDPDLLQSEAFAHQNLLANVYIARRKYREASAVLARALEEAERQHGATRPQIAALLNTSGLSDIYQGRAEAAVPKFERSLEITEAEMGPRHPIVARQLVNLAEAYVKTGRESQCEAATRRALDILEDRLGPDHPALAAALTVRATALRHMNRVREAKMLERRAQGILARSEKENLLKATVEFSALRANH